MLSKEQEKTIAEVQERVSAQGAHVKRCEDALIEAQRASELATAAIATVREDYIANPKRSVKSLESVLVEPRRKAAEAELAAECARHDLDMAQIEFERLVEVARATEINLLRPLISTERILTKYRVQIERLVGLRRELRLLTKDIEADVAASRKVSDRLRELGAGDFTWATAESMITVIGRAAYEPFDHGAALLAATCVEPPKVWSEQELAEFEARRQWLADADKREAKQQQHMIANRERNLREMAERQARERREEEAAKRAKAEAVENKRLEDLRLGLGS